MLHRSVPFASAALVAAMLAFAFQPSPVSAQAPASLAGDDVVSLLVRLGVNDTAARDWDGSVEVAGGELLGLRDWRPRPANEVEGNTWTLASYKGANFTPRAIHDTQTVGPVEYYRSPGLVVDVRGNGGSRLMFATANGEFEVRLADVAFGRRLRFLGGDVTVERVPGVERMTSDGPERLRDDTRRRRGLDCLARLPGQRQRDPGAPVRRTGLGRSPAPLRGARRPLSREDGPRRGWPPLGCLFGSGRG